MIKAKPVWVKVALVTLYVVALFSVILFMAPSDNSPILNPQGTIADQQRTLMVIATLLMLIVVIPVFVLVIWITWRYRAGNKKAKYAPDMEGSRKLETIWWGLPLLIIVVLSVFIWQSSHDLDHYRPIASDKKPVKIQVVAMNWKWLFIYPEQSIATVNYLQFPEKTPIDFTITSDAPMNSFWIPSLGGQVYAMSGMSTKLHLMADKVGSYNGSSANLSGEGFAGMKFTARSVTDTEFENWANEAKRTAKPLDAKEYNKLSDFSKNHPETTYFLADDELYAKIIDKYMGHMQHDTKTTKGGH